MFYLSQLLVNRRDKQLQRDLRDYYQLHKTLAKAFENTDAAQQAARVLFRVDEFNEALSILVQSKTAPDWSCLSEGYCLSSPQVKQIDPILPAGSIWRFRLHANPTKADASQRDEKRKRGKRIGIYPESERIAWLHRKADINGFRVLEARVRDEGRAYRHQRDDGEDYSLKQVQFQLGANRGNFSAASFDGVLEVINAVDSARALENGIGPAKAFGFGLLSLRRA